MHVHRPGGRRLAVLRQAGELALGLPDAPKQCNRVERLELFAERRLPKFSPGTLQKPGYELPVPSSDEDSSAGLPARPGGLIDAELCGGPLDRPTHLLALAE